MKIINLTIILISFFFSDHIIAQNIPSRSVVSIDNLSNYLKVEVKKDIVKKGEITTSELARYFRDKFSERYFYNWRNFDKRFLTYKAIYPEAEAGHSERALDHMAKYPATTQWKLPFNYQFGEPVNAYALRHLARQHKMVDIAFYYNYQDHNPKYLNYFKEQLQSLNKALVAGDYDKIEDGNGVYEVFRSGYRILNWLQIHNMFLGQENYSNSDQLTTIATLLQHGAHLFETNQEFNSGNHQTRGMSALAMISILLRDFEGTNEWYNHSMKLLSEHLSKEINDDGFQFERTVHYHMSDIGNYFYVYQLAKTSNFPVSEFWENKLKSLFTTLIKIAYPDRSAPVLSDDTDDPWAEKNDISGALTLGYVLFDDAEMGYFANNHVDAKMFWYLSDSQLEMLNNIKTKKPAYKSLHFPTTGYYIMRQSWEKNDHMMIISAGLDELKPDHQHGDMLGIQAMANSQVILPNYQVRYYLKDLELFKNSMTKNVALVDNELQGKQYTSNKGGSGFGKFKDLPNPKVISWSTSDDMDVFVGSHNGFNNVGVEYSRQVIYLKNDFWIVKDNFKSDSPHSYKQVWQGHYSNEHAPNLIRATFDDGSGLDIYQLIKSDEVKTSGQRGKEWSVVTKNGQSSHSFITLIYPYKTFDKRIDEESSNPEFKGWKVNNSVWKANNSEAISLTKGKTTIFYSVKTLLLKDEKIEFNKLADVIIDSDKDQFTIRSISVNELDLVISYKANKRPIKLKSGEKVSYNIDN